MSLKNPVKYPVKYYSHLDAGAPQIADADGAIKTILKACLVTGYGAKESAGWLALFDDAFRIVLRRPLRTGNPPDIKIENGIINGVASHRIVSQDNPTGLDDSVELASVNLLARDSQKGVEWHMVVSDFGFVFCYQMGYAAGRNAMLYVGALQNWSSSDLEAFVTTTSGKITRSGIASTGTRAMLGNDSYLIYMTNKAKGFINAAYNIDLNERYLDDEYLMQKLTVDYRHNLPFFCNAALRTSDITTSVINSADRPMLRYFNAIYSMGADATQRPFYIPLDYWEL